MLRKLLILSTLVLLALVGCNKKGTSGSKTGGDDNFVGKYTLDANAMATEFAKRMESMPPAKKKGAAFGLRILKTMTGGIEVRKDGTATMTTEMKLFGKVRKKSDTGTWKKDGDKYLLTRKTKKGVERTMPCKLSGKTLRCTRGKSVMIFNKS